MRPPAWLCMSIGASDPINHSLSKYTGNIKVSWGYSGTAVTDANDWLKTLSNTSDLTTASGTNARYDGGNVYALKGTVQDQSVVIAFGSDHMTPAPEPGSLVGLAGMGLIGLAIGGVVAGKRRRGRLELR